MRCVWEHNGDDTLLHAVDYVGAYTRGENLDAAIGKMEREIAAYCRWCGLPRPAQLTVDIVGESSCDLQIADADSDVLFEDERSPLTETEYLRLRELAMGSARDFHRLYLSVPDPDESCLPPRQTFYGERPRTARQMYAHTRSVNAYYFGEIDVAADNDGTIFDCRRRGFDRLEQTEGYLQNRVIAGSYGELWSLRKLLRRFIWHDRIHARAMYRMAVRTFGAGCVDDPFFWAE